MSVSNAPMISRETDTIVITWTCARTFPRLCYSFGIISYTNPSVYTETHYVEDVHCNNCLIYITIVSPTKLDKNSFVSVMARNRINIYLRANQHIRWIEIN
jgi:hypothetical protein